MYLSKIKKLFYRLLAILMIISVMSLNFPGMLLASEKSVPAQTNKATENSIVLQSTSDPASKDSTSEMVNKGITSPSLPNNLPSSAIKGNELGNGIFTKHESNMPKFDETPKPFTPDQNANSSNQNSTPSNAAQPPDDIKNTYYNINNELADDSINQTGNTKNNDKEKYPIKNKAGLYTIGFTSQSGQNLLRFTNGNASLLLSPLNPTSVTGKVNKNTRISIPILTCVIRWMTTA